MEKSEKIDLSKLHLHKENAIRQLNLGALCKHWKKEW